MNTKILKLIEEDAKMSIEDIAAVAGITKEAAAAEIAEMESAGIIRGYKGIIDWSKADSARVSAIIELKVMPAAGLGFEDVAKRISEYPEVESVALMSGAYDLSVIVKGKTFQEIAMFVAKELAVIDSVTSTATNFIMKQYTEFSVELCSDDEDRRVKISL